MKSIFNYTASFVLESGQQLDKITIAYSDYGPADAARTIWVCHALSGSSEVLAWWPGLFGAGQLFDPKKDRIICANVLGSCYGTTHAGELENPLQFPVITIKDMVKAHQLLADHLGLEKIDLLIGASLGGQQALEWAVTYPDFVKELIVIAANAFHSPYARALNETQRLALEADLTFGLRNGGQAGLKAARAIAMISYRSYEDFAQKQSEKEPKSDQYRASSYVRYQGEKFVDRFNAYAYYYLSKAMDSHDILRGRSGDHAVVLSTIKARTLIIGIDSDTLFPVSEQRFLAAHIPGAEFGLITSPHGHDSFLIDYEKLNSLVHEFLQNGFKKFKPTQLKSKVNYSYN